MNYSELNKKYQKLESKLITDFKLCASQMKMKMF